MERNDGINQTKGQPFNSLTPALVAGLIQSGKVIRPAAELARSVYDHATERANAAEIDLGLGPAFFGMVVAEGILYSVAAELSMKCVLQQSNIEYEMLRRSHDLGELFKALPEEVKEYAKKRYQESPDGKGRDLAIDLEGAGKAIMTLRYVSENRTQDIPVVWFSAMESVALSALSTIQDNGEVRVPNNDYYR